jgi:hypothetical protein
MALAAATLVLDAGDPDLLALQETVRARQTLAPSDCQSWLPAQRRAVSKRCRVWPPV